MKKFIKNLAVASLAIAGILVSSCKVEDIKTTFEATKAVATITVTAKDALHGNADISTNPALNLTASSNANCVISKNGNVFTIEGAPALQAQTVTITGEYNGNEGKTTVDVNSLLAGGESFYGATVLIGTPVHAVASAHVQISVWDNESEKEVTADATFKTEGAPSTCTVKEGETKGSFVITSDEAIAAFDLKVTATYKNATGNATVKVGNVAVGDSKSYVGAIALGEAKKVPAIAHIPVVVIDGLLEEDVTADAEITAKLADDSKATWEYNKGVITITAGPDLKIAAQTVAITAVCDSLSETVNIELSEIPEGSDVKWDPAVIILKNPARYYPILVDETTEVTFGTFKSDFNQHLYTHDYSHEYTHDYGHSHVSGYWMYNETEFILNTYVRYDKQFGTKGQECDMSEAHTPADVAMVLYYAEALQTPWTFEEEILDVTVSAFARYSAFGTKITTTLVYDVMRVEDGKDDVVVGTITLTNVATQAEYCEAAMPGHEGHYHYGHGHDDIHGYSSNAGGGIIFAE